MASWLTGVGLVLDIAGVVLLFIYGVPGYPERSSAGAIQIVAEQTDEDEKRRVERAYRRGKCGLALLIAGFAFQLGGVFLP